MCLAPNVPMVPRPTPPPPSSGNPAQPATPLQVGTTNATAIARANASTTPVPPAPEAMPIMGQRLGLDALRIGVDQTKMGPDGQLPAADRSSAYGPPTNTTSPTPIGMFPTRPRFPRIPGF